MKLANKVRNLCEFSDLENEVIDLADGIVEKEPKAKKAVDKVMHDTIDVENIRHESDKDLKRALKELRAIAKKFKVKTS